ncbi:hypothetical protein Tco_0490114 [Tanacetum coccineum]
MDVNYQARARTHMPWRKKEKKMGRKEKEEGADKSEGMGRTGWDNKRVWVRRQRVETRREVNEDKNGFGKGQGAEDEAEKERDVRAK